MLRRCKFYTVVTTLLTQEAKPTEGWHAQKVGEGPGRLAPGTPRTPRMSLSNRGSLLKFRSDLKVESPHQQEKD